jgi:nucleotide-binding universal stress UspA family protein
VIQSILVAVDGSPLAARVLEAGLEIGDRFDARVRLLRAILVPPEFPAAAHMTTGDQLPELLRKQAVHELQALATGHPRARSAPPEVRTGTAWRVICEAADELAVDLVVIGSHGFGGWDRVLGTTAQRVVNHASRNVLVVRP